MQVVLPLLLGWGWEGLAQWMNLSDKVLTGRPSIRFCVFLPPPLDLLRSPSHLRWPPRGDPVTTLPGT